jgi:hypothetical protein
LIGMLAAQKAPASGFVSLEGASRPPDTVLRTQLAGKLPADLKEFNENALTALKNGKTVDEVPPTLAAYPERAAVPDLLVPVRPGRRDSQIDNDHFDHSGHQRRCSMRVPS